MQDDAVQAGVSGGVVHPLHTQVDGHVPEHDSPNTWPPHVDVYVTKSEVVPVVHVPPHGAAQPTPDWLPPPVIGQASVPASVGVPESAGVPLSAGSLSAGPLSAGMRRHGFIVGQPVPFGASPQQTETHWFPVTLTVAVVVSVEPSPLSVPGAAPPLS